MLNHGLFALYRWTILAGAVAAPTLSLLGCQLAARDRAMQTLCITQGALVGVLVGMAVTPSFGETDLEHSILPPLIALIFSLLTHAATERLVHGKESSRNTHFALIFCFLVSCGYLVTALLPQLENHMTHVYFGDLATLSTEGAEVAVAVSLITLIVLVQGRRRFTYDSFNEAVFGTSRPFWKDPFHWYALTLVSFSVQHLGFLYTTSMLFVPTAILSLSRSGGLSFHLLSCALLAAVSSTLGMLVSLSFPRLPTVPSIVIVMCFLGSVGLLVVRRTA